MLSTGSTKNVISQLTNTVALTLNFFPTPACLVKMRHETKRYWNIIKTVCKIYGRKVDGMKLLYQEC